MSPSLSRCQFRSHCLSFNPSLFLSILFSPSLFPSFSLPHFLPLLPPPSFPASLTSHTLTPPPCQLTHACGDSGLPLTSARLLQILPRQLSRAPVTWAADGWATALTLHRAPPVWTRPGERLDDDVVAVPFALRAQQTVREGLSICHDTHVDTFTLMSSSREVGFLEGMLFVCFVMIRFVPVTHTRKQMFHAFTMQRAFFQWN